MKENIIGKKFNRLLVLEQVDSNEKHYRKYKCLCECGNITHLRYSAIVNGYTKSCGCLHREVASKVHSKGYNTKSKEYKTWAGIKRRCYNKNDHAYHRYGGRGITMCDEWKNSYLTFLEDMGECPVGCTSIDRINNNKGYSKDNCRWTTKIVQANNTSTNKFYTYNGETDTLANLCRKYNKRYKSIHKRLYNGFSIEDAFAKPSIRKYNKIDL